MTSSGPQQLGDKPAPPGAMAIGEFWAVVFGRPISAHFYDKEGAVVDSAYTVKGMRAMLEQE